MSQAPLELIGQRSEDGWTRDRTDHFGGGRTVRCRPRRPAHRIVQKQVRVSRMSLSQDHQPLSHVRGRHVDQERPRR